VCDQDGRQNGSLPGPGEYVFLTSEGNPHQHSNVSRAFEEVARKANLNPDGGRNLRFHDLRRVFASALINAGQPPTYAAEHLLMKPDKSLT
jgi:integrase